MGNIDVYPIVFSCCMGSMKHRALPHLCNVKKPLEYENHHDTRYTKAEVLDAFV